MPVTPSTCATNARRRGWPCRRRPIRRATSERSPSAPMVSLARRAWRWPSGIANHGAGHRSPSYSSASTAVRSSTAAPAARAAPASVSSSRRRESESPVGRKGVTPAWANRPCSRLPARGDDPRPVERGGAGRLELRDHAQAVEQADRLRAHVLGAGLVAREGGAIHRRDAEAGAREERGRGAAAGAGPDDQHVDRAGVRRGGILGAIGSRAARTTTATAIRNRDSARPTRPRRARRPRESR